MARSPAKKNRSSAKAKNDTLICRYVTPAGRRCRRLRREPMAVCSVHRKHDPKFVALDLAKAARRIMWTRNSAEISKKLVTFAQHGRIPPDLAEKMIYTAFVLADNNAKIEIDIWSRNIALCAGANAEHAPELVAPDPARLEELRRVLAQFGTATEAGNPEATAAPQAPVQQNTVLNASEANDLNTTSPASQQTTDNSSKT